jgi:hypothetical protein
MAYQQKITLTVFTYWLAEQTRVSLELDSKKLTGVSADGGRNVYNC